MDKQKQYKIVGLIALAVVALTATLISLQGTDLQGQLTLKPSANRDLKPVSGEPGPYSGEPATSTVNKAELAKLVVSTLNADPSSYSACAPDVIGKWYENYACYMVSRNLMNLVNDGKFNGEQLINRAEAAKVFTAAFVKPANWYAGNQVVFKDVPVNQWFYVYVMTLAQNKVLDVEPLLPNQLKPLDTVGKKGLFFPADNLTKKAATTWAQKVSANLMP